MFGTVSRIASGDLLFVAALPGIALGARVGATIPHLGFTLASRRPPWRNRAELLQGRDAIEAFLTRTWNRELDRRLIKEV
jgi:hypothetical protein